MMEGEVVTTLDDRRCYLAHDLKVKPSISYRWNTLRHSQCPPLKQRAHVRVTWTSCIHTTKKRGTKTLRLLFSSGSTPRTFNSDKNAHNRPSFNLSAKWRNETSVVQLKWFVEKRNPEGGYQECERERGNKLQCQGRRPNVTSADQRQMPSLTLYDVYLVSARTEGSRADRFQIDSSTH